MVRDSLGRLVDKPQYGGWFTQCDAEDPLYWDKTVGAIHQAATLQMTNEQMLSVSWLKGPSGTGETAMRYMITPNLDDLVGLLAESWEVPDDSTVIWRVRKGVHWHDKPPTSGRELTADDVAFTFERIWKVPTSYHRNAYPFLVSVKATDKYTVVMKTKPGFSGTMWEQASYNMGGITPRDMVEKWGNMQDWRASCGTGPYVLKDYVPGSGATLVRHPNYWMKDPLHPENQLPYPDGIRHLIIKDVSTRLAAMRTAKLDHLGGYYFDNPVDWDDAMALMQTNPELKYVGAMAAGGIGIAFRIDKPQLPFYDIRVRRALSMAVDRDAIVEQYYRGNAIKYYAPIPPIPEYKRIFTPLNEQPEEIRELWEYHPDKAKKLLADAGYPNGFKTSIVCSAPDVDWLSIVKDYWAKIGVDLKLDVKEWGALQAILVKRSYEGLYPGGGMHMQPRQFVSLRIDNRYNVYMLDDPKINKAYEEVNANFWDQKKQEQILKETYKYVQTLVLDVSIAIPKTYTFWQPWVKNYNGELGQCYTIKYDFVRNIWLDLAIKEKMTGRR